MLKKNALWTIGLMSLLLATPIWGAATGADLSITKTDGATMSIPGSMVTYTIAASNAGPSDAMMATVTDTFPGILSSCTWTCSASAGSSCTAAGMNDISDTVTILNGGTVTYTATCTISASATGSLSNTASVAPPMGLADPNSANDSATDVNTLVPTADLSITKTDSADPVDQGAAYSYTVTVSNAGPSDATGVSVADTLPAGVSLVDTSGCTEDPAGVPTCTLGTIAAGGMASYTINVTAPSDPADVTNTATVSATTTDNNATNDTAMETTTVLPEGDLSITKTDGVTVAVPGTSVTYTIVAANAGPDAVTGATVADTFPAVLSCTWTCTASAGSSCSGAGAGDINDSVDLLSGGSATYTAICTIPASATGSLSNTATITAPAGFNDPNMGNESATDVDTLTPEADLSITKTDSADPVAQGAAYSYTITVSNAGPSDATGVSVADTLPAGVTFVDTTGCTEDPNGVPTCTLGSISAGGMASYTINVTAPNSGGDVINTATVSATTTDPNSANDTATETTTVPPESDLSITKTDGVATAVPGESVTYTIVASNAGPDAVIGATVDDTFPAILTCTWTCNASAGSSCTAAGSGDIADTVDLLNGGTVTYTADCTIDPTATGSLSNTATVTAPVNDPDPGNNSATDVDTLDPMADLSLSIAITPDPVSPGSFLTLTLTVVNAGPSEATNVVVTGSLPPGATFDETMGCIEDPNGFPTCSLMDPIAPGDMASFTLLAIAPASTTGGGNFDFSATSDAVDPDTSNNDDVSPIVFAVEIPTMGEWGLLVMTLLLSFAAVRRLRQRASVRLR